MADEMGASWVRCSLDDARRGKLPPVSVVSGAPATATYEGWVKVGFAGSINAAAGGQMGIRSSYAKVHIPMTDEECRRVPRRVGQIASLLNVIFGFVILFGGMAFFIGLTGSDPGDRAALLPGAGVFFGGIALFASAWRWRWNRNKCTRTRFDYRTDELKLYACPAFADAVADTIATPLPVS